MRKIILLIVIFPLFFLFISYLLISSSHAQSATSCPIALNPPQVENEYNRDITVEIPGSSACVLQAAIEYTIFFCPSSNLNDVGKGICASDTTKPKDAKTLIAKLNLFDSDLGDRFPGLWHVTICTQRRLSDCKNSIFATGYINVGADPTPTPPSDLPIIDALTQLRCKFQVGESVTLTATNITPGRDYQWWWNGEKAHNIGTATGPSLTFTIPGSETTDVGIRNVCVEDKNGSRTRGQSQHCITLEFSPGTPPGDTSCNQTNSGTTLFNLSKDQPDVPPPPCLKSEGEKCVLVDTAIGPISTDPADFVKSIFSLVLGLAGGIALILIMVSGYKFMTSSGNPEAVKAATEQLTSAIIGLLFIIFSFVILQIIGVDVLKIPGFKE